MSNRTGAVHVATTKRKYKGKVYTTYLLRRTYREGSSVKHETLGNLSHLPKDIIEMIGSSLRGERWVPVEKAFEIVRSLPHGHVAAVIGILRKLGLEQIISSRRSKERDMAVAMVASRIIEPCSKLATARGLTEETLFTSLGETLGVKGSDENDLYFSMDWILARQSRIESILSKKHLTEGSLVFYDVSSSYFEGRKCPLASLGHNRDGKKGNLQIVYGLLCNEEGCPVAVEVFDGCTGDPKTFSKQVEKIRKNFKINRVVMVGDRGMITEARIKEDLRPIAGLDWITALRASSIRNLVESGFIQLSLFDQQDMGEITHPDYPAERLIACKNPLLAEERGRKREELLLCTERELEKIAQAAMRTKRKLKGKEEIALRVGRVINRYKVQKHFTLEITENSFSYKRNEESIDLEKSLDGIYVIRTSVPGKVLDAEKVVGAYKNLSAVERAFRSLKTVDLKVRPINHHLSNRVRAHIFLCMLAYYVEWHMRKALALVLFDDDDKAAAKALRTSVVAPAKRSFRALQKTYTNRTDKDLPVHSFQTLLKDLATLAKNRVRLKGSDDETFAMFTTPTTLQQHVFDLLGVSYKM